MPSLKVDILQAKIADLNEHILKWSEANEIPIIKPDLAFRLGTGDVDDMCYGVNDKYPGSTLNRFGALRLLGIIAKQCPTFHQCRNLCNVQNEVDRHHNNIRGGNPKEATHLL